MDIEAVATEEGIAYIASLVYDPEEAEVRITLLHNPDQMPPEVFGKAVWSGVKDFASTVHDETDHRADFEAQLCLEQIIGISELPAEEGRTVCVLTDVREIVFFTTEPPHWIALRSVEKH